MTPEQEIKLLKELLYCTKRSCNNCGKVNCENFQRQRIDCCGLWVSYKDYIKQQEEKINDIKANCDLAIEGRDIKIKELEQELTVEKDLHQEETNLHLHAEEYIKELEKEKCELIQEKYNLEYKIENLENKIEHHQEVIDTLQKGNAKLKVRVENQKSFLGRIRAKFNLGEIERKKIEGYLESEQLTKAKLLLEDVYKIAMEDWNDPKWHDQVLQKTREYLKEIEK